MGNNNSKSLSRFNSRHSKQDGGSIEESAKSNVKSRMSIKKTSYEGHRQIDGKKAASLSPSPANTLKKKASEISANYHMVNGRRYQNYSKKYVLPLDDIEQDKLTQLHYMYQYIFDGNFKAPVKDLLSMNHDSKRNSKSSNHSQYNWMHEASSPKVLDIACGDGAWILEMATDFPNSQCYGIDIVTNYPVSIKPPNAFFSKCDILKSVPFPEEYFDFIHMRQVYACFSEDDWEIIVKQVKRLLKPGGYVEFRDVDPLLKNPGPACIKFFKSFPSMMKEKHDVNIYWSHYMYNILNELGEFSDLNRKMKRFELSECGTIGETMRSLCRAELDSFRLFFEKENQIAREDYDRMADEIIQEAIEYKSYLEYYSCWGRKSLLSGIDIQQHSCHPLSITRNSTGYNGSYSQSFDLHSLANSLINVGFAGQNSIDIDSSIMENQDFEFPKPPLESQVASLEADNVSDIDQFAAGYED